MISKETIKSEIEKVPTERLEELYEIVRSFTVPEARTVHGSFMSRLRKIQIDGPEDFATNLDLYLTGEKPID